MEKKKFEAIMIMLVPQVIELICENHTWNEITATDKFYSSEVYALLEQEDTKVWHFSPLIYMKCLRKNRAPACFVYQRRVVHLSDHSAKKGFKIEL